MSLLVLNVVVHNANPTKAISCDKGFVVQRPHCMGNESKEKLLGVADSVC